MAYTHFDGLMALGRRIVDYMSVSTISTAAAVTFTPAQILGGIILRDCNGGARADLLPTAATLLAAMTTSGRKPPVGAAFEFTIRNTSGTAVSITVTTNTGLTLSGTMTIAQSNSKRFLAVLTDNRDGNAAFTVYSLGTVVH